MASTTQPATWLTQHAHLLPAEGEALDVACGRGRHALWLAARGLTVHAVDRSAEAVAALDALARQRGLPVRARVSDLETPNSDLPRGAFDLIVVVHYLHRPLFPALNDSLAEGGVLIYETFMAGNERFGKPSNPAFLLQPGELLEAFGGLAVVAFEQGTVERPAPAVVQRICAVRGAAGSVRIPA